jgi:hypothetical protein
MWIRGGIGVVLCAVGAVWIGQGTNHIKGSFMTGHKSYAALGVVLVVIGAALPSGRSCRRCVEPELERFPRTACAAPPYSSETCLRRLR